MPNVARSSTGQFFSRKSLTLFGFRWDRPDTVSNTKSRGTLARKRLRFTTSSDTIDFLCSYPAITNAAVRINESVTSPAWRPAGTGDSFIIYRASTPSHACPSQNRPTKRKRFNRGPFVYETTANYRYAVPSIARV